MPVDFKASQIRVNQIINSGSTAVSPLLVYGVGAATNQQGGIQLSHFPGLGSDVWLYISGTRGAADNAYGAVSFRGDVVVSGAFQIGDGALAPATPGSGKGVIFARTGSLYFKNDGGSEYDLTAGGSSPVSAGTWNELSPSPRLNTTASVSIAGGLGSSYAAESAGSDVFLFVSGTNTNRLSLFGGGVTLSGSLKIKDTSSDVSAIITPQGVISGSSSLQIGGSATIAGDTLLNGSVTIGNNSSDNVYVSGSIISDILPKADSIFNLGSPTKRWANIYTGDLHLRNDRGDWTVIEEETFLRIVNNKTGKNFKIVMEPLD